MDILSFKKYHATVNRPDDSVALTATKRNDLYIINNKEERVILTSEKRDRDLIKWYQKYGHLNIIDLKSMKNNDIILGMKFASQINEINCEIYAKCKIHVYIACKRDFVSNILEYLWSNKCKIRRWSSIFYNNRL